MRRRTKTGRTKTAEAGALVLVAVLALTGCTAQLSAQTAASGGAGVDPIVEWIDQAAVPLETADATAPLDDLAVLPSVVGDATVVGLGESAHGLGDQFALRHRIVRYLVEEMGFRLLAWEADYGSGVAVDRYVVDGVGDPRQIVGSMVSAWQSEQMLALVEWMRAYNRTHSDKVRFVGTDLTQLRQLSLDEISSYVRAVAPGRLDELAAHLSAIHLHGDPGEHVAWYYQQTDKESLIGHARAVRDLIAGLPATTERDDVLRHAEAVLGFYLHYAQEGEDLRDRFMADSIIAWQRRTGHKTAFWGANVHVAAAEQVEYAFPPTVSAARLVPVGHWLRQQYGTGYAAVAGIFGSGEVLQGFETGRPAIYQVPVPRPGTTDHTLAQAGPDMLLLDLNVPAKAPAVRAWRDGPATLRLIGAAYDIAMEEQYAMTVRCLSQAFDVLVYIDRTRPSRLLR
ncbi:erythromycin esterase family protein [Pseudonocardia adelaidensis]|uniref:Erythromycin esterase family protein n=1 Tax=Pseudonocardia adelaidensis TaxID=648754 RepID=A0ABP9NS79_9PSEU